MFEIEAWHGFPVSDSEIVRKFLFALNFGRENTNFLKNEKCENAGSFHFLKEMTIEKCQNGHTDYLIICQHLLATLVTQLVFLIATTADKIKISRCWQIG